MCLISSMSSVTPICILNRITPITNISTQYVHDQLKDNYKTVSSYLAKTISLIIRSLILRIQFIPAGRVSSLLPQRQTQGRRGRWVETDRHTFSQAARDRLSPRVKCCTDSSTPPVCVCVWRTSDTYAHWRKRCLLSSGCDWDCVASLWLLCWVVTSLAHHTALHTQ